MINLFITPTEQNNQKKFVTAGIAATMQSLGYSVGVYKPIEIDAVENNGFLQSKDLMFIKYTDNFVKTYFSYMFNSNQIPILAAAKEKIEIEKNVIFSDYQKIEKTNEILLIDGSNGLKTPYNKNFLEEDIPKELNIPLLLIVSAQKTSINNALLSLNRINESKLKNNGVIITGYDPNNEDKKFIPKLIEEYSNTKVIGVLPELSTNINPSDLIMEILNGINIEDSFRIKIAKLSN